MNEVERAKLKGFNNNFRGWAERNGEGITEEDWNLFKWDGIYHQLQHGYYMIRVKIPGGRVTAHQARGVAHIADRYCRGVMNLTTRQDIQYHWVTIQNVYRVMQELETLGLTTKNACGDTVRNVVACPWAGLCSHEPFDVTPYVKAVHDDLIVCEELRNLPRKFKISFNGCSGSCAQPQINDIGYIAVRKVTEGVVQNGFRVVAAGGLGAKPHLAKAVFDFIPAESVVPVSRAFVKLFRDHGNRRVRTKARMKFVMMDWGIEKFRQVLLDYIRQEESVDMADLIPASPVEPAGAVQPPDEFVGTYPQKQRDRMIVRALVPRGDLDASQLYRIADLAEKYGDSTVTFTNRQNFEFHYVHTTDVNELVAQLRWIGFDVNGHSHLADVVACVGTTLCTKAVAESPSLAHEIMNRFGNDQRYSVVFRNFRIHINGCPNACAQHHTADIGFQGIVKNIEGVKREAYQVALGGHLEGSGRVGDVAAKALFPEHCADLVKTVLDHFMKERHSGESFVDCYERKGIAYWSEIVRPFLVTV